MKDSVQLLPRLKKRKLIKIDEFEKIALKVTESLNEEREYLYEKKLKNENTLSSRAYLGS